MKKPNNSRQRKPGQKIVTTEGSEGQNPFYPGEDAQQPGTIEADGETTHIPVVDSVPHKPGSKT